MRRCKDCRVRDGLRNVMLFIAGAACMLISVHLYMHGDRIAAVVAPLLYLAMVRESLTAS